MSSKRIVLLTAFIVALLGFASILFSVVASLATLASAISIREPYLELHCNVNTDFLEKSLCSSENCVSMIIKTDYGDYRIDNVRVFIREGEDTVSFPYSYGEPYNVDTINETTFNFLENACIENISPVITRIEKGNFMGMWCDFRQDRNKLEDKTQIESIDGWHLGCSSYTSPKTDPMTYVYGFFWIGIVGGVIWIPLVLMFSFFMNWLSTPLIILALILIYLKKRGDLKLIYILPLTCGFVGGLISYFKSPTRKVGLKLLLLGLLISFIFGLFFTFILASAFL